MLPDLLKHDLNGVIVGTAAGSHSAKVGNYYAKSSNKFWATLHKVGFTPRRLRPDEYPTLLEYRLGLTDLVKTQAGMDNTLSHSSFDIISFTKKIEKYAPTYVCFNGKRAAEEFLSKSVDYGLQPDSIGSSKLFVAHSTSGAGNRWWKLDSWIEFAGFFSKDIHRL